MARRCGCHFAGTLRLQISRCCCDLLATTPPRCHPTPQDSPETDPKLTETDPKQTRNRPNLAFSCRKAQGNPKGGLAKGGLARKAPIGPKRALWGNFCSSPRGCGVRRNWSRSAPKRPRQALKRLQSAPKRPDFPGRISPRFSLKIWGSSPRL